MAFVWEWRGDASLQRCRLVQPNLFVSRDYALSSEAVREGPGDLSVPL